MHKPNHLETHNINDNITFKVTERGRGILAVYFANMIEGVPPGNLAETAKSAISGEAERTVADDGVTMTVWQMANLFGEHITTLPPVIEGNEFTFVPSDFDTSEPA